MKVFCQKHANGIVNSEDPDQTAWVCTVCLDLSIQKLRIITVYVVFLDVQDILTCPQAVI